MVQKAYRVDFTLDDLMRVRFTTEKGRVTRFVVQYQALIEGAWKAVVRFDTAHGYAHKDTLHPDGSKEKQSLFILTYGQALTNAIADIMANWSKYRQTYEKEMKR